MKPNLYTIGVYGYSEAVFFQALVDHQIDTFCDIRLRRGMRGAKYAFVNSRYLQEKLADLGIAYLHFKTLAPSKEIRAKQQEADQTDKVKKRERETLSPAFIEAYQAEVLARFDAEAFLADLGPDVRNLVLFCVEKAPAACHRSLLAARLVEDLGLRLEHLTPCES